jgi:hypothetical protein
MELIVLWSLYCELSHHNLEYLRVFPRFQYYILASADHQINKIVFVFALNPDIYDEKVLKVKF